MKRAILITTLFLDIGGVLLTDGWDHHARKRADIFRLALDVAQAPIGQILYIENTPMFVRIAERIGIGSILHADYRSTRANLASFGLRNDEGVIHETNQPMHPDDQWRLVEHQVRAVRGR